MSSGFKAQCCGEIDFDCGNTIEVVGEDAERHVGHDLAFSVTGLEGRIHFSIGPDTTVLNDLNSERERGLLLLVTRGGTPGIFRPSLKGVATSSRPSGKNTLSSRVKEVWDWC
jgi:hypothetical protein